MAKLFQSFSQAKDISSKYGGTGLGLVISKVRREEGGRERSGRRTACEIPTLLLTPDFMLTSSSRLFLLCLFSLASV
jgi:hypothetical protein